MKVSYQWLSEYVDLTEYTAQDLAEKLTRSGIEVDSIEKRNKGVSGVVTGYIVSKEKHPDADKLSICTVDVGLERKLQIVCGANNVDAGQVVPVAVVGAVLPGDFAIKKAKLRGVESEGMICSAKELGLNDKLLPKEIQEGILALPAGTGIGLDITEVLGIDDEVLELDLTPNRSDCLSMIGVAYEIAAIIEREVELPDVDIDFKTKMKKAVQAADHIHVKISAIEQCSHYAARYIENVQIGPSPLWIQSRLMSSGIRPINNIVDITNYVLLEYGQPLHAFDADQLINGQIEVRLAQDQEQITTLDQAVRTLEPHMLLITDGVKPVAVAGVMGGANSEVSSQTTRILLESANFAGSSVRKTSRQLGLRSEASLRFEKEVNPDAVIPALNRAAALIAQYAGGYVSEGIVEAKAKPMEPACIFLSLEKINQYLGTSLVMEQVKQIFDRLRFNYKETGPKDQLSVTIPKRRGDITGQVDLIEEIARLYGYDNIPTTLMNGVTTPGSLTKEQTIRRAIRGLLTSSGLHEVVNYSLTPSEHKIQLQGLYKASVPIQLSMPMSEERGALRTGLIPHLLDVAVYNRNRNIEDIAIFEMGNVFITGQKVLSGLPEEKLHLSMLWTGTKQQEHWSGKGQTVDFFDIKGILEKLMLYLGVRNVVFKPDQPEGFHPSKSAQLYIQTAGGAEVSIGFIGQLHPAVQQARDLEDTYVMEIALAPIFEHADFAVPYKLLPRYPAIGRDMAIIIEDSILVGDIVNKIRETAGPLLESVKVFDIYTGERLGKEKKSVAFALVYRHRERTLTDEEVSSLHGEVVQALTQTFAAELRK
ncbi:MAG TPA: phenylalanine--tRNA ligase subunit beta [Bacilli bacterium]